MLSAPGPMDAVTARAARRWEALAKPLAMWTRPCSLRPWMNGRVSEYWSSACPSPATLPWPKIPSAAGIRRRRSPSATLYCLDRYRTSAWAVVRRIARLFVMSFSFSTTSPGLAVQNDGLFLGHLRDGGAEAFLADARGLEAAVGHEVGAPQRRPVDVDDASVDLAHGAHGGGDVLGEHAGAQPVGGGVRVGDGGGPVLGLRQRDRGAKELIGVQGSGRGDVVDDGGGEESPVAPAAGEQRGPPVDGCADRRLDPAGLGLADEGSQSGAVLRRIAVGDRLDLGDERVQEVAVHLRVGDDALDGDAHLAGVDVPAGRDGARCGLDVRVRKDHDRARCAELEGQLLHPGGACDVLADRGRAGEGDLADPAVSDEGVPQFATGTGEDVKHTWRQPGVGERPGEGQRGQWGCPGRLEDDGVAGG